MRLQLPRKINDTNTNVPGSATTYAIENTCPSNPIGDSFNVQTHFSLNKYPYTSDISKAYLRIIVDDGTAGLRIFSTMTWSCHFLSIF